MFAIASPALNSTALAASPAVLAAPVVDAVSTRQTSVAVAAPLPDSDLADNTQSHVTIIPAAAENNTPAASQTAAAAPASAPVASGPSTPFLAQLISQNVSVEQDSQIGLSSTFSHFLPAPAYNQLVGYSVVKYRPSDAGLPSSYYAANADTETTDDAGTTPAAVEYNAYNATQTRNQYNLANAEPQVSTAG